MIFVNGLDGFATSLVTLVAVSQQRGIGLGVTLDGPPPRAERGLAALVDDFKSGRPAYVHDDPADPARFYFQKDEPSWLAPGVLMR